MYKPLSLRLFSSRFLFKKLIAISCVPLSRDVKCSILSNPEQARALGAKEWESVYVFEAQPGIEAAIPKLFISKASVEGEAIFNVRFQMRLLSGGDEEIEILLPKTQINPEIPFDKIEHESLSLAEDRKIYKGRAFEELVKTFSAGLVAVTYPIFDEIKSKDATIHIDNLFAMDDWVDAEQGAVTSHQVRESVCQKMEILRKISKLSEPEMPSFLEHIKQTQTSLTYAYAEEFIKQILVIKKTGIDVDSFIDSLDSYFNSVIQEKYYEEKKTCPSEIENTEIRADASGAVHAICTGAAFLGIDLVSLEKRRYPADKLKIYVARSVEFSNDIFSLLKEHKVLGKANNNDLSEIKKMVAFNIVQIMWQGQKGDPGATLKDAIQMAVQRHNQTLLSYYCTKKYLLSTLDESQKSFESRLSLNPEDSAAKQGLEILREDIQKLDLYFKVLEGWLAHGWWALGIPRYNLGITLCNTERLLNLQSIQDDHIKMG